MTHLGPCIRVNRFADLSTIRGLVGSIRLPVGSSSGRARTGDAMTRGGPGDGQHGRQGRPRSVDRCGRSMPARQGNSGYDGLRGCRGCAGVARLALSAFSGQGVIARSGDRPAQRGVVVRSARDARAFAGPRRADRQGSGQCPHRLRRPRRAVDAAADGRTRGIRRVRRRRRAGAGAGPRRVLAPICRRSSRQRRDPPRYPHRRSVGMGGPRGHLAGHRSRRHAGPERSGPGARACTALRDAGPEGRPGADGMGPARAGD